MQNERGSVLELKVTSVGEKFPFVYNSLAFIINDRVETTKISLALFAWIVL